MIAFHGSSFCLYPFTAQSNDENRPPQIPKFPPRTGARAFIAETEPINRSPYCVNTKFGMRQYPRNGRTIVSERGVMRKIVISFLPQAQHVKAYPGTISGALDTVPYASSYCAHREGSAEIIENDIGTGEMSSSPESELSNTPEKLDNCAPGDCTHTMGRVNDRRVTCCRWKMRGGNGGVGV
jgi:hypothetical protein